MNIEISKSNKKDKKLMAVIDGKKLYALALWAILITQHIKTLIEHIIKSAGSLMKIGVSQTLHHLHG